MMNNRLLITITLMVIIVMTLLLSLNFIYKKVSNTQIITNQNTSSEKITLIGSYLSDSQYSMAMFYVNSSFSYGVSTFLWNIHISSNNPDYATYGGTYMTYNGKFWNITEKMWHIVLQNLELHIIGYPGFIIGYEDWFPFDGLGKTLGSPIPAPISSVKELWSTINYSVWYNTGIIVDFSYDIWLTNVNPLDYPYLELNYSDALEVLVWIYHQETLSSPFVYLYNVTFQAIVNGTEENLTFEMYELPRTGGPNGWPGIYFVLPNNGFPSASISLPLGEMAYYAASIIGDKNFYLDAIQVGMESYYSNNDSVDLGYFLYSFNIGLH